MDKQVSGLLLIGGKSSRMGRDKGKLSYGGISQRLYQYALLEAVCEEVYFSCSQDQEAELKGFPCIVDQHPGQGPLGGILTALQAKPHTSFLVLACDMPCITLESLHYLLRMREPRLMATAMQHPHNGIEPLFTIWESSIRPKLEHWWLSGNRSPRKFLSEIPVQKVPVPNPEVLTNINTPQEYQALLEKKRKLC